MISLFISDSLGLPNKDTKYEDTVPYHLAKEGNVWLLCHMGATVTEFEGILVGLSGVIPDDFFEVAVIQLGLSDCAPRPLAIYWRDKLSRLRPSLRKFVVRLLHKHRPFIQKYIGYYQRTPYTVFREKFDRLLKMTAMLSGETIVILMPPIQDSLSKHSPGIRKEINKYNACMKELSQRYGISVLDAVKELDIKPKLHLTSDGHLTKDGNEIIIKKLAELSV